MVRGLLAALIYHEDLVRARGVALLLSLLSGCGTGGDGLFCDTPGCAFSDAEWNRLQALAWTKLGPPPEDRTNAVAADPAAARLGALFFADPRFSGLATQVDALRRPAAVARAPKGQPTNLACTSCHDLGRAGADTASVPGNVSSGAGWTDVNALAIENCAYQQLYTWNGRADSLWAQAFAVAENPTTMNGNRLQTAWVIADNYREAYDAVFGPRGQPLPLPGTSAVPDPRFPLNGKPGKVGCQPGDVTEPFGDAFDCMNPADQKLVTGVLVNWAKALAAYETTRISAETPFDRFLGEGPDSSAISAAAQRGARLFVGKAGCVDCHGTPLLSDRDFHNVGVPQIGPAVPIEADCPAGGVCDCVTSPASNCLPWGQLDGLAKLKGDVITMLRTMWSDGPAEQSRAAEVARAPTDALKGAWRTPSLRNVSLTAPYMHDGIYATLDEVVAHYNRGGDPGAVGTHAVQIRPLGLTTGEQADLVAFLETLSPGEARSSPLSNHVPGYTFDLSAEGWTVAVVSWPNPGFLAFDFLTGDPQLGSLKLTLEQESLVEVDVAPPADLAHQTLRARVMLDDASVYEVQAYLFAVTDALFGFPTPVGVAGAAIALVPGAWTGLSLEFDPLVLFSPVIDPTHVTRIGVGVVASARFGGPVTGPTTVHIDSVVY
jgi:cytochrome c peroxidase